MSFCFRVTGMEPSTGLDGRISAIAALDQPLRRQLYDALRERGGWMTRDEAADAVGIARTVAAFHLDKLAEAGVLDVSYERTSGRTGPGAGRPSKRYRPTDDELAASVPDRRYDLAGVLLAEAVAESTRSGTPVDECLQHAARAAGRAIGREVATARGGTPDHDDERALLIEVLDRHGYEPAPLDDHEVALLNCPFHRLAEQHRALVCGMNLDFLDGLVEGFGPDRPVTPRLAPEPGYCCVRLDL